MAGGPKKHLKRIATPNHWCLDKLDGIYAPRPSCGPHKLRECIPLALLIRNRLKYALTYDEVKLILMQKLVKIDGKVRTDKKYPIGYQDVVTIEKTKEHFRMLYDVKGRFVPHKISAEDASFKLCRVRKVMVGRKQIPYAYLHDGRTIRFASPDLKVGDSVKVDIATGKPTETFKFEVGALGMITGGKSVGRVGKISVIQSAVAKSDIVTLIDTRGEIFSTVFENVFIIGDSNTPAITLEKDNGVKKSIIEIQQERLTRD